MPKEVYAPLLETRLVNSGGDLEEIIRNMVQIGKELDTPVG